MKEFLASEIRRARKLAGLWIVIVRGLLRFDNLLATGVSSRQYRAAWLHGCCTRALGAMGIEVSTEGVSPGCGLFVSNHLSYLDILVFSAALPCVFVSKGEVRHWPIFGRFARMSGTIFVAREIRGDAARANAMIADCLSAGVSVILFPEGTTTGGERLLPFHAAMLQPAIESCDGQVTPCAIAYDLPRGDVRTEVCWWGGMTLLPHVLGILRKTGIRARITFGEPVRATGGRKELAVKLRERVEMLRAELCRETTVTPMAG